MKNSLKALEKLVNMKNLVKAHSYLDSRPALQAMLNIYTPESVYRKNTHKARAILSTAPTTNVLEQSQIITHKLQAAIRKTKFAEQALFWKHSFYSHCSDKWEPVTCNQMSDVISSLSAANTEKAHSATVSSHKSQQKILRNP